MTEEYDLSGLEDPNPLVETTEVAVDPLITTKLAYVDNLKKELEGIQEQMTSLQYQLDIRVTALTMYQSALEVKEEEPKENGKDKEDESNS
jgi:hypothetical protein